jgi:membrane-associated phospholipid phosphatase
MFARQADCAYEPCTTGPEFRLSWRKIALYAGLWALAIAAACAFDIPITHQVYSSGIYQVVKSSTFFWLIKTPGRFYFTLILVPVAWSTGTSFLRAVLLLYGSAGLEGLFYTVINWTVGRQRPIENGALNAHPFQPHFFAHGLAGLFMYRPDQAFPSGHTALAFASAAALSMCLARWRVIFFVVATMVGIERILEGAHYVSDVVAGAGIGIFAALLARLVCDTWLPRRRSE